MDITDPIGRSMVGLMPIILGYVIAFWFSRSLRNRAHGNDASIIVLGAALGLTFTLGLAGWLVREVLPGFSIAKSLIGPCIFLGFISLLQRAAPQRNDSEVSLIDSRHSTSNEPLFLFVLCGSLVLLAQISFLAASGTAPGIAWDGLDFWFERSHKIIEAFGSPTADFFDWRVHRGWQFIHPIQPTLMLSWFSYFLYPSFLSIYVLVINLLLVRVLLKCHGVGTYGVIFACILVLSLPLLENHIAMYGYTEFPIATYYFWLMLISSKWLVARIDRLSALSFFLVSYLLVTSRNTGPFLLVIAYLSIAITYLAIAQRNLFFSKKSLYWSSIILVSIALAVLKLELPRCGTEQIYSVISICEGPDGKYDVVLAGYTLSVKWQALSALSALFDALFVNSSFGSIPILILSVVTYRVFTAPRNLASSASSRCGLLMMTAGLLFCVAVFLTLSAFPVVLEKSVSGGDLYLSRYLLIPSICFIVSLVLLCRDTMNQLPPRQLNSGS